MKKVFEKYGTCGDLGIYDMEEVVDRDRTMEEEYKIAVKKYGVFQEEGDYKDMAEAQYAACSMYAASADASVAFKRWFDRAPDAYNCPRSWSEYAFG